MRRGYIQIYTGNGKGKTTAALGLALRAAGAGLKVFIAQFVKQKRCSEHLILERLGDSVTVKRYGKGFILKRKPTDSDRNAARAGLDELRGILSSKKYDVIILDEANIATHYGLISVDDLLDVIAARPAKTELVITGRYADKRLIRKADLVTEMREVKHYMKKGVRARVGIEW